MKRLLCVIVCVLLSAVARAQEVYQLRAPPELLPMLRDNLPQGLTGQKELGDEAARLGLVRRLRKDIPALLAVEGYFSPEVEVDLAASPLVVRVVPGPRARIASVSIDFSGAIKDAERFPERQATLRSAWSLKVGQPFRQADWNRAKDGLMHEVLARDFPAARLIESVADVDPVSAQAQLKLSVDSGPAFKLGKLDISGLSDYSPAMVERYSPLREGESYDQDSLLQFQSALQNTPYFAAADVSIDADPANAEQAVVHVRVAEAKPRGVTIGVGFSTNTGFRSQFDYRDANWLDRAWQLNSGISLEQKRQSASTDVFFPPAEGLLQYSVGGLLEASDIERLNTRRALLGVARSKPRGDIETRIGLSIQIERNRPDEGEATEASALALNWSWTRRHVDNLINPRSGYVLNVQLGGGLQLLLSDANFFRSYGRLTYYLPLGARDQIIARGEGGYTATRNLSGVPQEFLFRTGGAQTVRGYEYLSLGPKNGAATVGGRYLAALSIEHNHWFSERWGSAVFVDAGNAANNLPEFTLKKAVGVGARFRSPAGPIAFDLGYSIDDHRFMPHISIAIAF